jgi:hypothetical protein
MNRDIATDTLERLSEEYRGTWTRLYGSTNIQDTSIYIPTKLDVETGNEMKKVLKHT